MKKESENPKEPKFEQRLSILFRRSQISDEEREKILTWYAYFRQKLEGEKSES